MDFDFSDGVRYLKKGFWLAEQCSSVVLNYFSMTGVLKFGKATRLARDSI